MDVVRGDLGLARARSRFPKKGMCLAIYSYTVNAGCTLGETLAHFYPWCSEWQGELRRLFAAYVAAKQHDDVLDYDDLLLYWREAARTPAIAAQMRAAFDPFWWTSTRTPTGFKPKSFWRWHSMAGGSLWSAMMLSRSTDFARRTCATFLIFPVSSPRRLW
jgi:hypothetical protein